MKLGFVLPARTVGPQKELPLGWLMVRRCDAQSLNTQSLQETLERESEETMEYVYISPKGVRFTSLKLALRFGEVVSQPLLDIASEGARNV